MSRIPRDEVIEGLGRVRLYDAGPKFADRYTILFMDEPVAETPHTSSTTFQGIAFGDNVGPNGFSQYIECRPLWTYGRGSTHRRIAFASLTPKLQEHLRRRVNP